MKAAAIILGLIAGGGEENLVAKRVADAVIAGDAKALAGISETILRSQRASRSTSLGLEKTTAVALIAELKACHLGSLREMPAARDGVYPPDSEASSTWACGIPATDHPSDEPQRECYDVSYRLVTAPNGKGFASVLWRQDVWSVSRCGAAPLKPVPVPLSRQSVKQSND